MTALSLPDALCKVGRPLHAAIPSAGDSAGAREALKAFSAHAIACQFCYSAVANVGGLVSMWGRMHSLKKVEP